MEDGILKKWTAYLLAWVMVFGCLPLSALAEFILESDMMEEEYTEITTVEHSYALSPRDTGDATYSTSRLITFSEDGITGTGGTGGYETDGTAVTIKSGGTYAVTGKCSNIKKRIHATGIKQLHADYAGMELFYLGQTGK